MTDDELFRWIFVAIFVAFLPFALYHRIRSNLSGEKLARCQEGAFILFGLRLSGLPWFIGGIVWMIDPKLMAWASVPIPFWKMRTWHHVTLRHVRRWKCFAFVPQVQGRY